MHESKLGLSSHSSGRALVISLEPWGEDYTFAPGQRVMIVARGRDAAPWFDVWIRDDGVTLVSIEGQVEDWAVLLDGVPVGCGYGRTSSPASPGARA